ncbi:MAG: HypC/HybG/HupF family hydrogenase formation chaperone [Rhodocyclaceae bacterium]|nr:HypC/HybG/HupF family hydrogenase formation chaperone [Rhodocyclaceae bacterium]
MPKQVVAWEGEGDFAWVERDGQREQINMMLLGAQPVGTWVLTSMGLAKEVIEDDQRQLIEDALSALAASLEDDYDPAQHFQDMLPGRHD